MKHRTFYPRTKCHCRSEEFFKIWRKKQKENHFFLKVEEKLYSSYIELWKIQYHLKAVSQFPSDAFLFSFKPTNM